MYKNQAGQKVTVVAKNLITNEYVTSDAANITAQLSKDGGAAIAIEDTNPTEIGGGVYYFSPTQEESNCDLFVLIPESSTEGVVLEPVREYPKPSAQTGAAAALADYDPPTKAELDSGLAALAQPGDKMDLTDDWAEDA